MSEVNSKSIKLAQLILSRVGVCDYWKLLKLMYFIDFENYSLFNKPITEEKYVHLPYGPVPDGYKSNLIEQGVKLGIWKNSEPHKLILQTTDGLDDSFTNLEQAAIDLILAKYGNLSGSELVALSHEDPPWYLTEKGEVIDYELVKWRDSKIIDSENITAKVLDA